MVRARARFIFLASCLSAAQTGTYARADVCRAEGEIPDDLDRDALLSEATTFARAKQYGRARAIYLSLVANDPKDSEARGGLARVDAWQGCFRLAEEGYREALRHHPEDADSRGGLIDLLLWQGRIHEAERELAVGFEKSPGAPSLWEKKAKLARASGNMTEARRAIREAERLLGDDPDVAKLDERIVLGEVRAFGRVDHLPSGYSNVYLAGLSGFQRVGRFEFGGGWLLNRRAGTPEDNTTDSRQSVGLSYVPLAGMRAGVDFAFSLPAKALPQWEAKGSFLLPLAPKVGAFFSYAFWKYDEGKVVHLFAPSLGFTPSDTLRMELRYWASYAVLSGTPSSKVPRVSGATSDLAHTLGGLFAVRPTPRLEIGALYTYGVQLDQSPTLLQLLEVRSHVGALFADWLVQKRLGIRPQLGLEHRTLPRGQAFWVTSAELGAYVRW